MCVYMCVDLRLQRGAACQTSVQLQILLIQQVQALNHHTLFVTGELGCKVRACGELTEHRPSIQRDTLLSSLPSKRTICSHQGGEMQKLRNTICETVFSSSKQQSNRHTCVQEDPQCVAYSQGQVNALLCLRTVPFLFQLSKKSTDNEILHKVSLVFRACKFTA